MAYFFQERLLFMQRPISELRLQEIESEYPEVEEIELEISTHKKLHGWLVPATDAQAAPLLIYFGGNAEEVSNMIDKGKFFENWSMLLVNYRGYGLSEGQPSEENLFQDARYLYDVFSKRDDINEEHIVAMGRSLGTGVAVHLAAQRDLAGVVLISPYDSISEVAKNIYPFLPVDFLLKHEFNSLAEAEQIDTPLLALVAEDDEVIPPKHSQTLYEEWAGEKELKLIEDKGHNDIQDGNNFWEQISTFLDQLVK